MKGSTIGFSNEHVEERIAVPAQRAVGTPRKSLVQVHFDERSMTLAYYNDRFDLHRGDVVYVEGKLEGVRGIIVDVAYTFKIRLSDYKRVVALVDTSVIGRLFISGSHFVAFESSVIPYEKVRLWYKMPELKEEIVAFGDDGEGFLLDNLNEMHVKADVAGRGISYYEGNHVFFVELNGVRGRALVRGTKIYELEFNCMDDYVRGLVCDCYCAYTCKHQVATMLQLKETLEFIRENYAAEYEKSRYFAAISKTELLDNALIRRSSGSFVLE